MDAALAAADDARIAAMIAGTAQALEASYSDDLHYGHSNGTADTRASLIAALSGGRMKYLQYENERRDFTFPAPGIALMTGRARLELEAGGPVLRLALNYLGVWRLEGEAWRMIAWQSCRLPDHLPR